MKILEYIAGIKGELRYDLSSRARPYLKVQDGCNNRCSYCAVPFARGNSRSILPEEAVRRATGLEAQGYKEIVLTGIHLGSYGIDFKAKSYNLSSLLRNLLSETSCCRFRISSLEINEISDELLEIMTDQRVCSHLHVPLQSGSDKILHLMKRKYSSEEFRRTILKILQKTENVSIGTDVIVGFPGEDHDAYNETLTMIKEFPFAYLHVFPYSGRPGTAAYSFTGAPDPAETKQRTDELRDTGNRKKMEFLYSQLGKIHEVIIEVNQETSIIGTSSNYLKVQSIDNGHLPRSLINIRSKTIVGGMLLGDVIN